MWDVGDVVPLGITVTDSDGVAADGGAVVVTVTLPDGTTVTPSVDHVAASGVYTADYTATVEGHHLVSWVVTGANATAFTDVFNVREIGDQIISLSEAKNQLGIDSTDRDDTLRTFIAAAGVAVEHHTGQTIVRRTITGEKHYRVCGKLFLDRSPVISLTTVGTVDGNTTWSVDDLDVDSTTGVVRAVTGPILYGDITVTYTAGKRVIPANELLAARIIVEHLWQTMRPFAASNVPAIGSLGDTLEVRAGGVTGYAIPNKAVELLGKPPPLVA